MESKEKAKKLKQMVVMLLPVMLIVSQVCVFTPATIYFGNIAEFNSNLAGILKSYVPFTVTITIVVAVLAGLLSEKRAGICLSLVFVVGILLWIQGNLLVWKYGLLDGQSFDWTKGAVRGLIDTALWITAFIIAVLYWQKIKKAAVWGSFILIFLQTLLFGYSFFTHPVQEPEDAEHHPEHRPLSDFIALQTFSGEKNVIHFVLDAFQSDIFQEIINENPEQYLKALEGFTLFSDTTGSFPTTAMSVPAILSGNIYKNQMPMDQFIDTTLNGRTIPNMFFKHGYDVDLLHAVPKYYKGSFTNAAHIRVPFTSDGKSYMESKSALLMDLALFRLAPHFLKKFVYNNQSWLIQQWTGKGLTLKSGSTDHQQSEAELNLRFGPISKRVFFNEYISKVKTGRKRPVYKYIHLTTTHYPLVMKKNCDCAKGVLPSNRENFKNQARCGLNQFIEFLKKLKKIGIYDDSLIVLQADHGAGHALKITEKNIRVNGVHLRNIAGSAFATMAIKPPNAKGDMAISNNQAMLTDTPATICKIMNIDAGFSGISVFDINPSMNRQRPFYYYKWKRENWQSDYLPRLDEFIIEGPILDEKSWQWKKTYWGPDKSDRKSAPSDKALMSEPR